MRVMLEVLHNFELFGAEVSEGEYFVVVCVDVELVVEIFFFL